MSTVSDPIPYATDGDSSVWIEVEGATPDFPFIEASTPDAYARAITRFYEGDLTSYRPRAQIRSSWSNLLSFSDVLTNAAWTATELTVTDAQRANPGDGTVTMSKLLETVTNAEHTLTRAISVAAAAHTLSVVVSALSRDFIRLTFTDSASTVFAAVYDLNLARVVSTTGSVTAPPPVPLTVDDSTTDYRLLLTFTPAAGTGTIKLQPGSSATVFSYAGTTTKGLYATTIQLSALSSSLSAIPLPIIPTTTIARTISAPDVDADDPFAYLVIEATPQNLGAGSGRTSREFLRIPGPQSAPTSINITKPVPPSTVGVYRILQPDSTVESFDAYTRKTVTLDTGPATSFYPSGGTYTLGLNGTNTASKNYNDAAATLQTALNAISPVSDRGNCAVAGSYNTAAGFTVTFNSYAAATVDTSSLTATTGSAISAVITTSNGGYNQSIAISATGIDAASPSADFSGIVYTGTPTGAGSGSQNGQHLTYGFNGFIIITGGTYTLTAYGQTTAAIAWNASTATVQAAVNLAFTNAAARGTVVVDTVNAFSNGILVDILITPQLTGGTFTITMFTQTTAAIAYNASGATIQAALNALSNILTKRGGVTVASGAGAFGIGTLTTLAFSNALLVADATSLTPAGSTITVTTADGGINRIQTVIFASTAFVRTFTAAGHGIITSDTIFLHNGTADYTGIVGTFTVPDANTISFVLAPGNTIATAATITELGKRTKSGYVSGTKIVRATDQTLFYLPGVSPGISTLADIPVPQDQSDDASFLAAVFAGAAINYRVGQWARWLNSSIIQQTSTVIAAADV